MIFTYPLGKILRIKERKQQNTLEIQTKDGISLLVYFTDKNIVQQTQLLISKYAFPSATYQMFCFVHKAVLGPEPAPLFDILSGFSFLSSSFFSSSFSSFPSLSSFHLYIFIISFSFHLFLIYL